MNVSHSIVVLPEAPPLSSLKPGHAFSFLTGPTTDRVYMIVEPWQTMAEELDELIVFVDLDTGTLYNSKEHSRKVNSLHAEVLVA